MQGLGSNIKCCAFHHRAQNWGELPWINSYGCFGHKGTGGTPVGSFSFLWKRSRWRRDSLIESTFVFLLRPFSPWITFLFHPVQQGLILPPFLPFDIFAFYFSMCFFPRSVLSSVSPPSLVHFSFLSHPFLASILDILFGILSGIYSGIFLWNSILLLSDDLFGIYSGILSGISSGIFIRAFYLTVYFAILSGIYSEALFLGILSDISILPFYLAFILALFFGKYSGIPIWHSFLAFILAFYFPFYLASFQAFILGFYLASIPSRPRSWDSALLTVLWSFAVEVRKCPLRSGARSWLDGGRRRRRRSK